MIAPGTARADEPRDRVSLEWTAPADCPDAAYVHAQIERLLGRTRSNDDRVVSAVASAQRSSDERFRLELQTRTDGSEGRRKLEAASCTRLADAAALIIALAVNPEKAAAAVLPPAPPSSEPADAARPVPTSAKPSAQAKPATRASRTRAPHSEPAAPPDQEPERDESSLAVSNEATRAKDKRWSAGAAALADTNTLPAPAYGVLAFGGYTLGAVRAELGAAYLPKAEYTLDGRPGMGGEIALYRLSGEGFYRFWSGSIESRLGGGIELTLAEARGFGVDEIRSELAVWPSAVLGGRVAWGMTPELALFVGIEAAFLLRQPNFELAGVEDGVVHRSRFVTARGLVGAEARF